MRVLWLLGNIPRNVYQDVVAARLGSLYYHYKGFRFKSPVPLKLTTRSPTVYLRRNILHSCVIAEQGSLRFVGRGGKVRDSWGGWS